MVTYKMPEEADVCIAAINNRWFGGRKLEVASWDGRTKHYVKETPEEEKARLAKWAEFLEKKSTDKLAEASAEDKKASDENPSESNVEAGTDESAAVQFILGAGDVSETLSDADQPEEATRGNTGSDLSKSEQKDRAENSTDSDEDFDSDEDS